MVHLLYTKCGCNWIIKTVTDKTDLIVKTEQETYIFMNGEYSFLCRSADPSLFFKGKVTFSKTILNVGDRYSNIFYM